VSHYTLTITEQYTNYTLLQQGVYLLLINCYETPPHLALVLNGNLYEYTIKNSSTPIVFEKWSVVYAKLKLPIVAIQLNELGYSANELEAVLNTCFNFKIHTPTSCLIPINEALQRIYNINTTQSNVVFDTLDKLKFSNVITHVVLINASQSITIDNELHLKKYTFDVVKQHIAQLKLTH
jgi:hypothetical protein